MVLASGGGGAVMGAHSGQSMALLANSLVLPSSDCTSTFITPEPLHTSKMSCGLTMGEATATPSDSTNHASTKRLRVVKWRRVCIPRLSSTRQIYLSH